MTVDNSDKPSKPSFLASRTRDGDLLVWARMDLPNGARPMRDGRLPAQGRRILLDGFARAGLLGHVNGAKKIYLILDTDEGMQALALEDLLPEPDGEC